MASVGIIPRLPSVTNVDDIAVRESVVKAVQTLGYDYPTKEQLDAVEQAIPATTRPVSCWYIARRLSTQTAEPEL